MAFAPLPHSLRHYVENILTPGEAETLAGFMGKVPFDLQAQTGFGPVEGSWSPIRNVIAPMLELGADITRDSYARVESKKDGHGWHYDTGDSDHMTWCEWSASVLLTTPDSFSGGVFQFADPPEEHLAHYLDAIIYTSDELHRVLPHHGNRKVLLVFLGAQDGE